MTHIVELEDSILCDSGDVDEVRVHVLDSILVAHAERGVAAV